MSGHNLKEKSTNHLITHYARNLINFLELTLAERL